MDTHPTNTITKYKTCSATQTRKAAHAIAIDRAATAALLRCEVSNWDPVPFRVRRAACSARLVARRAGFTTAEVQALRAPAAQALDLELC